MVRTRSETMGVEKSTPSPSPSPSNSNSRRRRKEMLTTRGPTIRKHVVVSKEEEKASNRKRIQVEKGISLVEKSSKKKKRNDSNTTDSIIQVGDTINLSDLLFTNYRDYLITCNQNNRRVKAKDLAGKVIVLYVVSLITHLDTWRAPIVNLRDIYSKLHPKGDFEIVFVALGDDDAFNHCTPLIGSNTRKCFRQVFSMMPPCPAIPLSDQKSRKRLENLLPIRSPADSFIIDPRGVVLQSDATDLLLRYGAAGYPFTNERIQFLDSEDNLVRMLPFSVPLNNLDDKVVRLYFCPCLDDGLDGLRTTRKLDMVYKELSKNIKDFEIVLIYTHGWCGHEDTCGLIDEDSFLDEIKTMPWLALPFTDTDCNKKLQRIFQNPQDLEYPKPAARLIIIGPHGKFIEPLGTNILLYYGAPAYPFTLNSAVSLELERVKKVKPEIFWDLDTIFTRNDGSQVRFSQFVGKRIIVLYQSDSWRCDYETLGKLKARYFQMKGTDDEFEVIHILSDIGYYDRFEAPMPWLMHTPFDRHSHACRFMSTVFNGTGGLLAFDHDGSVVRVTRNPLLGDSKVFPYHHCGDMDNEVLLDVKEKIGRGLESVHPD
ncbi:hypothetical protein OROMI_003982 [Orobanche minor]